MSPGMLLLLATVANMFLCTIGWQLMLTNSYLQRIAKALEERNKR